MLRLMGGKRVVFHPAAQGKDERSVAVMRCVDRLKVLRDYIYLNGMQDMMFCPETMGKLAQIGTPEEIAAFSAIDPVFTPCIDFGHVNARTQGSLKTAEDYRRLLEGFLDVLGYERMKHFHVHFSKIMYGAKGEIKHLTFEDEGVRPRIRAARPRPLRSQARAVYRQRVGRHAGGGRRRDEARLSRRGGN